MRKIKLLVAPIAFATLLSTPLSVGAQTNEDATTYFVDCTYSGPTTGSVEYPFNTLEALSDLEFKPGDQILFKDGTVCHGAAQLHGSGTKEAPIRLTNYGDSEETDLPHLIGGQEMDDPPVIEIKNESHWEISNLVLEGGWWQTMHITADEPGVFSGFRITDLEFRGNAWRAGYRNWRTGAGGLIIQPCNEHTTIRDIEIVDIHTFNNSLTGIQLGYHHHRPFDPNDRDAIGGMAVPGCHMDTLPANNSLQPKTGIMDAIITFSHSHDNLASGIQVFGATNVRIAHNNLHHNGGGHQDRADKVHVSGMNGEGAWWDSTDNVVVEYNEAWANREGRSGDDGAGLDADRATTNSVIQYNYLHDNANYGVSIISGGAESSAIIRYNIMRNNGRIYPKAPDIMISRPYPTGGVGDVSIVNNTLIRDDAKDGFGGQAIRQQAKILENANLYSANNLIVRAGNSTALSVQGQTMTADYNVYAHTGGSTTWWWDGNLYSDLESFQANTGQEKHGSVLVSPFGQLPDVSEFPQPGSYLPDPDLMGQLPVFEHEVTKVADFFGNGGPVSVGAVNYLSTDEPTVPDPEEPDPDPVEPDPDPEKPDPDPVEPDPEPGEPDPDPVEPNPDPVEPNPDPVEPDPDPDPVEPNPDPVEPDPDPDPVEPDPDPVEPNPDPVEPNPDPVEPDPDPMEPNPDPVEPDPDPVEPNPDPVDPPRDTPVPGADGPTTDTPDSDSSSPAPGKDKPAQMPSTGSDALTLGMISVLTLALGIGFCRPKTRKS